MPASRSVFRADLSGIPFRGAVTRSAEGHIGHELTLPVAHAGTLTTRTDDTSGVAGFDHSTGIAEDDRFDLYWDGGRRYAVLAGAGIDNEVPFSGGGGDLLPLLDTAIVACERVVISTSVDGDLIQQIMAGCTARGFLGFWFNSDILALGVDLAGGETWRWVSGGTPPNPVAGDAVAYCTISHADAAAPADVQLVMLYDSLEDS